MKAFIFDLDGVIVSTDKFHYLAWKKFADIQGIYFDEAMNEEFKGVSRKRCLEILLQHANREMSNEEQQKALVEKNNYYLDHIENLKPDAILPGVLDLFDYCERNDIFICLGSASKNAGLILERLGISHRFDVIVDGNQVTKAKPDPEVFLRSAMELNIDPKQCVVFEDAQAGVQAAKSAGMYAIAIGLTENYEQVDVAVQSLEEVKQHLEQMKLATS